MSLKELFGKNPIKQLSSISKEDLTVEIESEEYLDSYIKEQEQFIPDVDFSNPENFAKFGLAERYYVDAIESIYNTYPYDGSNKEKIDWQLSSSYLERFLFNNGYPRSTGYVVFGTSSATSGITSGYGNPVVPEYILTKGGPGIGRTSDFSGSNKYDINNGRECNLRIGNQNTVEFWLKKNGFNSGSTSYETVFDAWTTSSVSSSSDYGRLRIELCATASASPWRISWKSGSSGSENVEIGSNLTTASIADSNWHHYAFRFQNSGSTSLIDLFIDGNFNSSVSFTGPVSYLSGTVVSTIGAINTAPSGTTGISRGYGKLSASLDEFRFWKTWRTSKDIKRYYFDQVHGGSNTDLSNTDLGVYYKFNEGITQTSSYDAIVLDYSGRVSNGIFVGYGLSSRNTGSAITLSSASIENTDPIIYSFHPSVVTYKEQMRLTGSEWDQRNGSSIYKSFPAWLTEEQESFDQTNNQRDSLMTLSQIMSSYFDTLEQQINEIPKIASNRYISSSAKPYPFYDKLLRSEGFNIPELFSNATVFEYFNDRNNEKIFEEKLHEVKNTIYENIYNNLLNINKSKGTEKSLRNLLHCFGINDDIYKLNIYSNNKTYELKDNFSVQSLRKNFINFSRLGNSDASVYQYQTDTSNTNSTSFISGTQNYSGSYECAGLAFTYETEILFPKRYSQAEFNTVISGTTTAINSYPLMLTSSLFGVHTAKTTQNDLTWATNDYCNFQVYAIKDGLYSNRGYLLLSSSNPAIPVLTSSYIDDLYEDSKWNFYVSIYPNSYPYSNLISGSVGSYTIEFSGIKKLLDYTENSFTITGSIVSSSAFQIMSENKRIYVGAHRTNFSGSVITESDIKVGSAKVWYTKLTTDELEQHAQDAQNFGLIRSQFSNFNFQQNLTGTAFPKFESLILNWEFETITGSNSSGQFSVVDITSGSVEARGRYDWMGNIIGYQYSALGSGFNTSSTDCFTKEYLINAKKELPEYNYSSNLINILGQDDTNFDISKQTNVYHMLLEKSMYQIISTEILKTFATVKNFNTLWGNPALRYRQNNNSEILLREHFFKNVSNIPDIEKYIEYFKWFDTAITFALAKLMPATSNLSEDHVRNIIESHIFENNKYKYHYPIFKDLRNENIYSVFQGIGKLNYNYKYGFATSSTTDNCVWQSLRKERTTTTAQGILDVIVNNSFESGTIQSGSNGLYTGSQFENKYFNKTHLEFSDHNVVRKDNRDHYKPIIAYTVLTEQNGLIIDFNDTGSVVCNDYSDLGLKTRIKNVKVTETGAPSGTFRSVDVLPFKLFSGSDDNQRFVNIHRDLYLDFTDEPIQGPFTEKYVGGQQSRHINLNYSGSRPEAFFIQSTATYYALGSIKNEQSGKNNYYYYRDQIAKRPININNIGESTSSTLYGESILGNFNKNYEIINTNGRSENNRWFVRVSGTVPSASFSPAVSGIVDFTLPDRDVSSSRKNHVFINRFHSPGSPETDSGGYLDTVSAEYSVYNALPWRNYRTIAFYNYYEALHCGQFGYDSSIVGDYLPSSMSGTYNNSASFQKTNKNRFQRVQESASVYITASKFDNNFVQFQIPRNDYQYSWISSSLSGTWVGYAQPDFNNASFASTDYTNWVSGAIGSNSIPLTQLNTAIIETINISDGVIVLDTGTSPLSLTTEQQLYAINLYRNGNVGWPSWKQIGSNKRLTQYFQRLNYLTLVTGTTQTILAEPIFTTKYKDLIFRFNGVTNTNTTNIYELFVPLGQNINKISKHFINTIDIDQVFGVSKESKEYGLVKDLILNKQIPLETNYFKNIVDLTYSENIYPREQFIGSVNALTRPNFSATFWRDSRDNRTTTLYTSTFGKVTTASVLNLDARTGFETASLLTASGQIGTFDQGELMNSFTQFHYGTKTNIAPGPLYTRKIRIPASGVVGDTKWEVGSQSNNPAYDNYLEYNEELRRKAKDYTVIPEFKISEHMDYYINQNYGNFLADNTASFSLTGAYLYSSSATNSNFYKRYSTTEFLKYFDKIKDDFKNRLEPGTLSLKCKGLVKLLPYDGFYPAQRTLQLVSLFSQSYGAYIATSGTDSGSTAAIRPVVQPLFTPGILYNTIKSGIAVDYPIYTQAYTVTGTTTSPDNGIPRLKSNFDYRVPFEAIIEPEAYLRGLKIVDQEPDMSASLSVTASLLGAGSDLYKLASHNFFAESINFFLNDGKLTTFTSLADNNPDFGNVVANKKYVMRIVCSNAKYRSQKQIIDLVSDVGVSILASQSYEYNPPTLLM